MRTLLLVALCLSLYNCTNPVTPTELPLDGPGSSFLNYDDPVTELSTADLPGGTVAAVGAHGKTDTCLYVDDCWIFPGALTVEFSMGRGTGWYNVGEFTFEVVPNDRAVVIRDPSRYFKCWYYRVIYSK